MIFSTFSICCHYRNVNNETETKGEEKDEKEEKRKDGCKTQHRQSDAKHDTLVKR